MTDIEPIPDLDPHSSHREVIEMARADNSLSAAWLLLGAQAAVIDAILDQLIGDDDGQT